MCQPVPFLLFCNFGPFVLVLLQCFGVFGVRTPGFGIAFHSLVVLTVSRFDVRDMPRRSGKSRRCASAWQHSNLDLALFGGTFDPVHNAHLTVARAARDAFGLHVLLVPAAVPPHKRHQRTESWQDRYRMVQLACAGERQLEASDLEAQTERSYSIDTIERVLPNVKGRLFFLIGADAFAEIQTWHRWGDVLAAVEFIVVSRPGHTYGLPPGAKVHPLEQIDLPVSSSAVREALARGEAPAELPPAVFDYIREHRLYSYGAACAELSAQ